MDARKPNKPQNMVGHESLRRRIKDAIDSNKHRLYDYKLKFVNNFRNKNSSHDHSKYLNDSVIPFSKQTSRLDFTKMDQRSVNDV